MFAVIFLFVFGMIGLTFIISQSKIMHPIRERIKQSPATAFGHPIYDLINCVQCAGFWVGLLCWPNVLFLINIDITWLLVVCLPTIAIMSGCTISILSVLVGAIIDWLTLNLNLPQEFFNAAEDE